MEEADGRSRYETSPFGRLGGSEIKNRELVERDCGAIRQNDAMQIQKCKEEKRRKTKTAEVYE